MSFTPWDPDSYDALDRGAAERCRRILLRSGYSPRPGHPVLGGYGSRFVRALAEFGWHLPYATETSAQFSSSEGRLGRRAAAETSFLWEARVVLVAAGVDPKELSVTVQEAPNRAKFSYQGRSGALRVGTWGVSAGIEFATLLDLPGHTVVRLSGEVDEALTRYARACLPDRAIDALCSEGLLEFTLPEGQVETEEAEWARHNRVGYWCGVASRTVATHVKVSWKDRP